MNRTLSEKYVNVENFKIRYFDVGEGDTILFIHPFAGAIENWIFNIRTLSRHFRTIALDLPGYGKSTKLKNINYSVNFYSDIVLKFIDKLKLRSIYLAGNSLGGNIALVCALRSPDKIKKLILVDAAGVIPFPSVLRCVLKIIIKEVGPYLKFYKPHPLIIKGILRWAFYERSKTLSAFEKDVIEYINTNNYRVWAEVIYKTIYSIIDTDLREEIRKINVPTLIIWGDHDRVLFVDDGLFFHEHLPNSKLVIFKNCGHFPHIEHPAKFNKVVLEFLKED